ncbi:hypothetical protein SESBI_06819 [Sesbania bispinosa]|nr:hypothetical protein SESBI_06819 [Sesbania bispinosa]
MDNIQNQEGDQVGFNPQNVSKTPIHQVNPTESGPINVNSEQNIQSNPCGPWMLVKRTPRKKISKREEDKSANNSGSRFNVLANEEHSVELVQQEVENPVQREQPAEQKVIRVRDPKARKSNQSNKSGQPKKILNYSKNSKEVGKSGQSKDTVIEAGKSGQSRDTIKVPKMPGKEHQTALPTTSLPERKGNATPVKNFKQKTDEHEYVLQLIKKMGSEKELQMYEKVWAASNSTI